ncbi:hypothetical protein D3C72_2103000 [compost metagenome]
MVLAPVETEPESMVKVKSVISIVSSVLIFSPAEQLAVLPWSSLIAFSPLL